MKNGKNHYFFLQLLKSLYTNWGNFLGQVKKHEDAYKAQIELLQQEIKQLTANLHEAELTYNNKLEQFIAKYEARPIVRELNALKKEQSELKNAAQKEKRDFLVQISLLTTTNKELKNNTQEIQEKITKTSAVNKLTQLEKELHLAEEMLLTERQAKNNSEYKLHTLLEVAERELKVRDEAYNGLKSAYEQIQNEIKKLQENNKKVNGQLKEWKEMFAMANEDMMQCKDKKGKYKEELSQDRSEIRSLKAKIDKLSKEIEMMKEGLIEKAEIIMTEELNYFASNETLGKLSNQMKRVSRNFAKPGTPEPESPDKIFEVVPGTGEYRLDKLDLKKFDYARPTYRALLTELLPFDAKKAVYSPPFPLWLQITIRAIFDSKWNEILLSYSKGEQISRFPDFVYSWLGTFTVDEKSKVIRKLEQNEKETLSMQNRLNLYLGLKVGNPKQLWEIHIFKDFLEENLSLDELVFFLHSRFIIYNGLQLSLPTSCYCLIHFVEKERIIECIDTVLYKYGADERALIKAKLIEYSKRNYKDGETFDSIMVLKNTLSKIGFTHSIGVS